MGRSNRAPGGVAAVDARLRGWPQSAPAPLAVCNLHPPPRSEILMRVRTLQGVACLLLVATMASGQPDATSPLDAGLRALEAGEPTPIRNRPWAPPRVPIDPMRPRLAPWRPEPFVEPPEFGVIL